MWSYQPSKKKKQEAIKNEEPIPLIYIPRKPHPNGLLSYMMATYFEFDSIRSLPYILDFQVHLKVGDVSPQTVVSGFINRYTIYRLIYINFRWKFHNTSHWIMDSGFGNFNLLEEFKRKNIDLTMSMKANTHPILWKILSNNLPIEKSRVFMNIKYPNQYAVASCLLEEKNQKEIFKFLITTAFEDLTPSLIFGSSISMDSSPLINSSSSIDSSSSICSSSSIDSSLLIDSSSSIGSSPSIESLKQHPLLSYNKDSLMKMKVKELYKLCKEFNIPRGIFL